MAIEKNLTGQKFGKLTILRLNWKKNRSKSWWCLCECGRECPSLQSNLTSGKKTQCMSCTKMGNKNCLTHGMARTPSYNSWASAKGRCYGKNNPKYPSYGGRGIAMCEEWVNYFQKFYDYMGDRPEGLTLGRIDNDGNYEPGNFRWETPKQQANNRRKSPPRPSHPNSLKNLKPMTSEWGK